jgi:hypothetical protein
MCVSPRGEQTLQLARQLTAAALNCIISSQSGPPVVPGAGGNFCSSLQLSPVFQDCNANVCTGNASQLGLSVGDCIAQLDCFNNGGQFDSGSNNCFTGTCGNDGVTLCNGSTNCGTFQCVNFPSNCHDRPLCNQTLGVCFNDPGPAGSPNECNNARDNMCTIIGTGEGSCMKDSCP